MKECKLIATLPNLHDNQSIKEIMQNDLITEIRYNSGINDLLTPKEIIETIEKLQKEYNKKIWIDIKGRQLRIEAWADSYYDVVTLNHEISIEYPAKIKFRGSNESEIIHTKGNKIVIKNPPERAVGKGQSVNITAKNIEIKGYLTQKDKELIYEGYKRNINNLMASFVENINDINDIKQINPNSYVIAKIESIKGIDFIKNNILNIPLMAARDDLYYEIGRNINMIKALKEIIKHDKNAICASKIFSSLDTNNYINLNDYEDLELMYSYGYRNYMLQDDFKGPKLTKALEGWKCFINE